MDTKHRAMIAHIGALIKMLESEWDQSLRTPLLVRIYGNSTVSDRQIEYSHDNGILVRLVHFLFYL